MPWPRLLLTLGVLAPLLVAVPAPERASASSHGAQLALLEDLNPDGDTHWCTDIRPESTEFGNSVTRSGDNYFFAVVEPSLDAFSCRLPSFPGGENQERALYVSDGVPGGQTDRIEIAVPQGESVSIPFNMTPIPSRPGSIIFQDYAGVTAGVNDGEEAPASRYWVTDGTPGGTCPIQRLDLSCDGADPSSKTGFYPNPPTADFYDASDYEDLWAPIATLSTERLVLPATFVEESDGVVSCSAYHPFVLSGAGGSLTLEPLPDLSPDLPIAGAPRTAADRLCGDDAADDPLALDRAGRLLASVGDVLYADLWDCNPGATEGAESCSSEREGNELYAIDLSGTETDPAWQLVGSGITDGSAPTVFGRGVGVAGDALYFQAQDGAEGGLYGQWSVYAVSGTSVKQVVSPGESPQWRAWHAVVGDYWYFGAQCEAPPDNGFQCYQLYRATWNADAGSTITGQAVDFAAGSCRSGPVNLTPVGTTLYFDCSIVIGEPALIGGDELHRVQGADGAQPPQAALVYDFGCEGDPASYQEGDASPDVNFGIQPYEPHVLGGRLYFSGFSRGGGQNGCPEDQLELFVVPDDGAPYIVQRFNEDPAVGSDVYELHGAPGQLFVLADDGIHGREPWVFRPPSLTVEALGAGTVTSTPPGIACPPTCEASFVSGATVTLTAAAEPDASLTGLTGCTLDQETGTSCEVTVSGDLSITAVFSQPTSFVRMDDANPTGDSFIDMSRLVGSSSQVGTTFFAPGFPDEAEEGTELYVTDGSPGGGGFIDIRPGTAASFPTGIVPDGGGLSGEVLFAAENGEEPPGLGPRLFRSDGTVQGTVPLQGASLALGVSLPPTAGFYDVSFSSGAEPTLTEAPGYGWVFVGSWWDGFELGPRVPYLVTTGGEVIVELSLPEGLSASPGGAGKMLAVAGTTVFLDLTETDCPSVCEEGRELYSYDLSADAPSWSPVQSLSEGSPSTDFGMALDVVGDRLFFRADPDGGDPIGIYVTDGLGIDLVAAGGGLSPGTELGEDWFYFRPNGDGEGQELMRYPASGGESTSIATCGSDGSVDGGYELGAFGMDVGAMEAIGDRLYFTCGEAGRAGSRIDEAIWSVDAGTDAAVVRYEPQPAGDGSRPVLTSLNRFGGDLYFQETPSDAPFGDLYRLTLSDILMPIRFAPIGSSRVFGLRATQDRLFVLADDGSTGLEPWADAPPAPAVPLSIAVSGPGAVVAEPIATTTESEVLPCVPDAACTVLVAAGSRVVLSTIAEAEVTFGGWTANCVPLVEDPTRCIVTMDRARTVGAFFTAQGDVLAVAASGPPSVVSGAVISFSVIVGNVTPQTVGDPATPVTLSGFFEGGAVLDTTFTPWCRPVEGSEVSAYECTVAPISGATARSLKLFARAPAAAENGVIVGHFAVNGGDFGDVVPGNDGASAAVEVTQDAFSIRSTSIPAQTISAGQLPYGLVIRNAAPAGASVTLRAGFSDAGVSDFAAPGLSCSQDGTAADGFAVSVTCEVGLVVAGGEVPVAFTARAPAAIGSDRQIAATFWVEYPDDVVDPDPSSDRVGPFTSLVRAATPEATQTVETVEPLPEPVVITTLEPAADLTPSDPTGTEVTLPAGFLGTLTSSEVIEEPTALLAAASTGSSPLSTSRLAGRRITTQARPDPAVFSCTTDAVYVAACWFFDVDIESALGESSLVYLFRFVYDGEAFRDEVTGRLLSIRKARFFHQPDGETTYGLVAACPRGTTLENYASYAGSQPCVLSKTADRTTGDYIFIVIAPENGRWKGGR